MKFLGYTLGDPNTKFDEPTPEMYARMGAFIEEATKAGRAAGHRRRRPAGETTKVTYTDGEYTMVDGPFTEARTHRRLGADGVQGQGRGHRVDRAVPGHRRPQGESRIRPVYS